MSLVGELNDLGLSDIFQILALSQRTGTLRVTTPHLMGQALFVSGLVVAGGLSDDTPTLGAYLIDLSLVSPQKVLQLKKEEQRGLGKEQLLQRLAPDSAPILAAMEALLRRIMGRLLTLQEGSFSFENDPNLDPWVQLSLAGTLAICPKGLQAQYLAMEALRLRDEAGNAHAHRTAKDSAPQEDDWSALLSDTDAPPKATRQTRAKAPLPSRPMEPLPSSLSDLRDVMQQLQRLPPGQNPANLLLRALRLHCERGAYFELRPGFLLGRGSFGLRRSHPGAPDGVDGTEVPLPESSALHRLLAETKPHLGPLQDEPSLRALLSAMGGGGHERSVLLAPWHVGGRLVGLLVGDNPSGQPLTDAPGVDILMSQMGGAGLAPAALRR